MQQKSHPSGSSSGYNQSQPMNRSAGNIVTDKSTNVSTASDDWLPEDSFHAKDTTSSYILEQRKQGAKKSNINNCNGDLEYYDSSECGSQEITHTNNL
jgi:hypothetical protein